MQVACIGRLHLGLYLVRPRERALGGVEKHGGAVSTSFAEMISPWLLWAPT